jgi:transposase-like protein
MVVMSKKRRSSKPEFKAQVVLELLREEKTVNELAIVRD